MRSHVLEGSVGPERKDKGNSAREGDADLTGFARAVLKRFRGVDFEQSALDACASRVSVFACVYIARLTQETNPPRCMSATPLEN